ncbi:MAG TPA: porin [Novosphingobium sp.]|nr:porin [Novosphingobium sp.]
MKVSGLRISPWALAVALGWALPVQAQSAQDFAAMRAEMEAMRNRIETLDAKVDALEAELAQAKSTVVKVEAAPVAPPSVTAKTATTIAWDGAPRIEAAVDPKDPKKGKWGFKPRGRLQIDTAGVDAPNSIPGNSLGIATEFRRAYLGVEGTIPGNFGYRVEADFANSAVDLTDVYLTYKPKPELTLTLGQHKPFWGLEEITSDLFTSFMERAGFNSAFGFERRVGLSAAYAGKSVLVQGGMFVDNAADLNNDANNSYSLDGRVVFMPRLGSGQLHLGGSLHHREFNDAATTTRYRARPFVHTTDLRLVDTRAFSADSETSYGAELAYVRGRFHATGEGHWIVAHRPGLADPGFFGGYAEAGLLLTDEVTAYKGGVYDRIRPRKPLGGGGMGALQLNARYDFLDLSDGAIVGGRQQVAGASLLWIPTDYVRFIVNYGHVWIDDAAVAAGLDRDYSADTLGVRAQIDF